MKNVEVAGRETNFIFQALEYAKRGWPVFPLHNRNSNSGCSCGHSSCSNIAKHPRTKNGFKDASTQPLVICNWWKQWPYANVAIATGEKSGLIVIDVDPRHGGDRSWQDFSDTRTVNETLKAKSGGGGFHLYFKIGKHRITNKTNILPGVDIRGEGGYIIAPPSQHASGGHYEWINDSEIAHIPEALLQLFEMPKKLVTSGRLDIPMGSRNTTLVSLGGLLRRHGLKQESISSALQVINDSLCQQPLPQQDIESISKSVSKYEVQIENSEIDWPDPVPLPPIIENVPKMTEDFLPQVLRPWAADICERMQIPLEFVAAPLVVSLSSLVGRRIGIHPKRKDDWLVIPNLWGGVIARPGFFKSPAIAEALKPLEALVKKERVRFEAASIVAKAREDVIRAKIEGIKDQVKKSVRKGNQQEVEALQYQLTEALKEVDEIKVKETRYKTNDATVEKIGALLLENPYGLLIFRDELSGWLKNLQKSGHEGDREFFLEAWNGYGSYTVDRIGRGTLHIPSLCLSVFGGLQPGKLDSYINQALYSGEGDDGLLQRFQIIVFPETSKTWRNIDRKPDLSAQQSAFDLFEKLSSIKIETSENEKATPGVRFSKNAQEIFDHWRENLELRLRKDDNESPAFESHLAKYRSMLPSLALIFHLCDYPSVDLASQVGEDAVNLAIKWARFLESHARRVYSSVIHSDLKSAHALAKKIQSQSIKNQATVRSVYRKNWANLENSKQVDKAIGVLEDLHWIRTVQSKVGFTNKEEIRINPKITAG